MKTLTCILLLLLQSMFAQSQSKTISISGTPNSDSARNSLAQFDTIFVASPNALPEGIEACDKLNKRSFPAQSPDDYLYEERFDSIFHVVLFDHIVTRKMLNVFLPTMNNPAANLCGVNLILTHPKSKQVVVFYDIFNWVNESGKGIFNTNKELHKLWNFSNGNYEFGVEMIHVPTGSDYTFNHETMKLKFVGF